MVMLHLLGEWGLSYFRASDLVILMLLVTSEVKECVLRFNRKLRVLVFFFFLQKTELLETKGLLPYIFY